MIRFPSGSRFAKRPTGRPAPRRLVQRVGDALTRATRSARSRSVHRNGVEPALPDGPSPADAAVARRRSGCGSARGSPGETRGMGARSRVHDSDARTCVPCSWRSFRRDVETRQMNLERLDPHIFEGRNLVTASALLDLVSESWLRVLAARCHAAGAAALFSITYNGPSSCDPAEPEDEMVRELMNLHQRTDKGLGGPAAGPEASAWPSVSSKKPAFESSGHQAIGHLSRRNMNFSVS